MTQKKIIEKLHSAFAEVEKTAQHFPEATFFQPPSTGKWSAAENVDHLFLSVKPLVGLFGKPEVMLERWGSSNRPSQTYEQVVAIYLEKVGSVGVNAFITDPENRSTSKQELIENLKGINNKFLVRSSLFTELELDHYQVPHPLIGLLTCREFLYFTHYHTLRHCETIRKLAGSKTAV
jgi:hypothetical protein